MDIISVRAHGVIDYIVAVLLVVAPFILGFANGGPAMWVPIILGIVLAAYSLMTRYPYSVAALIPLPVHLGLDVASGILLLISPWLFGFSQLVWWPHVIVGAAEIVIALCTQRRPFSGDATPEVEPRGP